MTTNPTNPANQGQMAPESGQDDATITQSTNGHGPNESYVIDVAGLTVRFRTPLGTVRAVNGVDLKVKAGETLTILGESGSGKSVTVRALAQLVKEPPGEVEAEYMRIAGREIELKRGRRKQKRSKNIAMIFQDPSRALNPSLSVGFQMVEVYRADRDCSRKEAWARSIERLADVGIPSPQDRMNAYAHQLSGGMAQRVMIALALMNEPEVLIADEPTTALDVTVQAQIMTLLKGIQERTGMALVLITHDIAVAGEVADEVVIMYAGRVVERGHVSDVLSKPSHPYTQALLQSIPRRVQKGSRLKVIDGAPPVMTSLPRGCSFHPRCAWAEPECSDDVPSLLPTDDDFPSHRAACLFRADVQSHHVTEVQR